MDGAAVRRHGARRLRVRARRSRLQRRRHGGRHGAAAAETARHRAQARRRSSSAPPPRRPADSKAPAGWSPTTSTSSATPSSCSMRAGHPCRRRRQARLRGRGRGEDAVLAAPDGHRQRRPRLGAAATHGGHPAARRARRVRTTTQPAARHARGAAVLRGASPPSSRAPRAVRTDLARGARRRPPSRRNSSADPRTAALVHNTIDARRCCAAARRPTSFPSNASAELDCRLLPDEEPDAFVRTIERGHRRSDCARRGAAQLPAVVVADRHGAVSQPRQAGAARQRCRSCRACSPGSPTVTTFARGYRQLRLRPLRAGDEEEGGREHGVDERMSTKNLREGTRRLVELLQLLDSEVIDHGQHQAHD